MKMDGHTPIMHSFYPLYEINLMYGIVSPLYSVHKSPPLVPLLSHENLIHSLSFYVYKIHSNIILLSTPISSS
jgi:hypothetical protein